MIKSQKVATVSSAIGYYGLNIDYKQYVKQMDGKLFQEGRQNSMRDSEEASHQRDEDDWDTPGISAEPKGAKGHGLDSRGSTVKGESQTIYDQAYHDAGQGAAQPPRVQLISSARHARPPTGMNHLGTTSNKALRNLVGASRTMNMSKEAPTPPGGVRPHTRGMVSSKKEENSQ